jgi:hypothetical protein
MLIVTPNNRYEGSLRLAPTRAAGARRAASGDLLIHWRARLSACFAGNGAAEGGTAMEWAALITWVLTAGGGFVLLALWLKNGGMAQDERGKIRPPLIMSHFLLAATGLVLWIVYVATDSDALAWIAFVLLAIVAALGLTMFAVWLRQRQGAAPAAGGNRRVGQRPQARAASRRSNGSRSRSSGCTECSR